MFAAQFLFIVLHGGQFVIIQFDQLQEMFDGLP